MGDAFSVRFQISVLFLGSGDKSNGGGGRPDPLAPPPGSATAPPGLLACLKKFLVYKLFVSRL